jgi:surfactin synthase thioesterase subunit
MTASRWTVRFDPRPQAEAVVVCIPNAGAGASVFRTWSRDLPEWVDVIAVQLPGRESRFHEPLRHDIHGLVAELADELSRVSESPAALFGHSFGGLLAFELARELRRRGREPPQLFLAACPPPHVHKLDSGLRYLPLDDLIAELRRRRHTPEAVLRNRDLMAALQRVLRADLALVAAYSYLPGANEPPLTAALSIFGGINDADAPLATLPKWSQLTSGPVHVRTFPGGHFFTATARDALLQAIAADLAARSAGHAPSSDTDDSSARLAVG